MASKKIKLDISNAEEKDKEKPSLSEEDDAENMSEEEEVSETEEEKLAKFNAAQKRRCECKLLAK